MPIIVSAASTANFDPAPAGPQSAVCSAVFSIGQEWSEMYQKLSPKVVIFWELAEKLTDGRPYMLSKRYTLSFNEKATLRKDLESWRGRVFTPEELAGFDLEKLVGANAFLNVVHVAGKKDGKIRAMIGGIMPLPKGMPRLEIVSREVPKWAAEALAKNTMEAAKHQVAATHSDDEDPVPHVVAAGPIDEPPF